jgi:hypothetical protein
VRADQLWHWIADKFELTTAPPPADDDPAVDWHNFTMDHDANLDYKYRAEVSYQFLLAEWAERPEIQDAWAKMAERYGLDKSYIKNVYAFSVADFTILYAFRSLAAGNSPAAEIGGLCSTTCRRSASLATTGPSTRWNLWRKSTGFAFKTSCCRQASSDNVAVQCRTPSNVLRVMAFAARTDFLHRPNAACRVVNKPVLSWLHAQRDRSGEPGPASVLPSKQI